MKDKDGHFLFSIQGREGQARCPSGISSITTTSTWTSALFEEYRKFSRFKHKDLAPYDEYTRARGLRWPVVQQKDGSWRETRFRFAKFDDPYVTKGEMQFYHSVTKDDRALIWFHPYETPPESSGQGVPLLALHRPRRRALAHGHHDHAHPPAARRHAPGLRRDEPRRRPAPRDRATARS